MNCSENTSWAWLTIVINSRIIDEKDKFFDPRLHHIGDFDIAIKISDTMLMFYKRRITYEINGNGDLVEVPSMQIETQMKF